MINVGIVRRIDELGRALPPKEMREILNMEERKPVEINVKNNHLVITKAPENPSDVTGIIRNVDELGRIVIPIEIRKKTNILERSFVEISLKNRSIIIKPYYETGIFCSSKKDLFEFREKLICKKCIEKIENLTN